MEKRFRFKVPRHDGHNVVEAIGAMLEGRAMDGMIMVELDSGRNMPMSALETATIAKAYLQKQGVAFRT